MWNLPNFISFLRLPLALAFLQQNVFIRIFAVIAAMISDGVDGFLARKYRLKTQFGAILDPVSDKFFVFFALMILYYEGRITGFEMAAMLCRDFSVILFGFYLVVRGHWSNYEFRSIWCGKITTVLQLFVLIALTLHVPLPSYFFTSFILLGIAALFELYFSRKKKISHETGV